MTRTCALALCAALSGVAPCPGQDVPYGLSEPDAALVSSLVRAGHRSLVRGVSVVGTSILQGPPPLHLVLVHSSGLWQYWPFDAPSLESKLGSRADRPTLEKNLATDSVFLEGRLLRQHKITRKDKVIIIGFDSVVGRLPESDEIKRRIRASIGGEFLALDEQARKELLADPDIAPTVESAIQQYKLLEVARINAIKVGSAAPGNDLAYQQLLWSNVLTAPRKAAVTVFDAKTGSVVYTSPAPAGVRFYTHVDPKLTLGPNGTISVDAFVEALHDKKLQFYYGYDTGPDVYTLNPDPKAVKSWASESGVVTLSLPSSSTSFRPGPM